MFNDKQLDAAESVASRAIDLLSGESHEFFVAQLHESLGRIHYSQGRKEKAVHHFNTALGIASSHSWHDGQFWIRYAMAELFLDEGEYDSAHAQINQAKSHASDDVYKLGRAMQLQGHVWYTQGRLEDATSEAVHALENYEETGAAHDAENCRVLLRDIELAMKGQPSVP